MIHVKIKIVVVLKKYGYMCRTLRNWISICFENETENHRDGDEKKENLVDRIFNTFYASLG